MLSYWNFSFLGVKVGKPGTDEKLRDFAGVLLSGCLDFIGVSL
jgi:hypothetical protein